MKIRWILGAASRMSFDAIESRFVAEFDFGWRSEDFCSQQIRSKVFISKNLLANY
jgi:hypothetical protein